MNSEWRNVLRRNWWGGWSGRPCEKNGRWKTGKEIRCPERGGKGRWGRPRMWWEDARYGKSGRRMGNNSKRRSWRLHVEREHSERKVRKEKIKKKIMVTMVNLTPDDMGDKRGTTTNRHFTCNTITITRYYWFIDGTNTCRAYCRPTQITIKPKITPVTIICLVSISRYTQLMLMNTR